MQQLGDAGVDPAPFGRAEVGVQSLGDQRVGELVGAVAGVHDQAVPHQPVERAFRLAGVEPGDLGQRVEVRHAGRAGTAQRGEHLGEVPAALVALEQAAQYGAPARAGVGRLDRAALHERQHRLADEPRVAPALVVDAAQGRLARGTAEQAGDQLGHLVERQRAEPHGQVGVHRGQTSRRAGDGQAAHAAGEVGQHAERVGVGQVQIVDGEERTARQSLQQVGGADGRGGTGDAERGLVDGVQQLLERLARGRVGVEGAQRVGERGEGEAAAEVARLAVEHAVAHGPGERLGLGQQVGLADAGLAVDQQRHGRAQQRGLQLAQDRRAVGGVRGGGFRPVLGAEGGSGSFRGVRGGGGLVHASPVLVAGQGRFVDGEGGGEEQPSHGLLREVHGLHHGELQGAHDRPCADAGGAVG